MGRKKRGKKENKSDIANLKGKYVLPVGAPSAIGAIMVTRFELDTNQVPNWTLMANMFQFWKVKHIQFHYVPTIGTQNIGNIYMCILEDPDSTLPGSVDQMVVNRVSVSGSGREHVKMSYRPKGPAAKWLYTNDQVTGADRLEFPGEFILATANFTASTVPGLVIVNFWCQFRSSTNVTVSANPILMTKLLESVTTDKLAEIMERLAHDMAEKGIKIDVDALVKTYSKDRKSQTLFKVKEQTKMEDADENAQIQTPTQEKKTMLKITFP